MQVVGGLVTVLSGFYLAQTAALGELYDGDLELGMRRRGRRGSRIFDESGVAGECARNSGGTLAGIMAMQAAVDERRADFAPPVIQ